MLLGWCSCVYPSENVYLFKEDRTMIPLNSYESPRVLADKCMTDYPESDGRSTEITSCPSDCYDQGETQERRLDRHACVAHGELFTTYHLVPSFLEKLS